MSKVNKLLTLIGIVFVVVLLSVGVAHAQSSRGNVTLSTQDTYSGPFIRAAQTVTIDGTVNGDVIAAALTVTINGTVNGSVYAAAQTITVKGIITGNLHAAAANVNVDGKITGSTYAVAGNTQTSQDSVVNGSLFTASGTVDINGKINGVVYAAGSTIGVRSLVGGDVTGATNRLTIGSSAVIGGSVKYRSSNDAQIDSGASIHGSVTKVTPQPNRRAMFGSRATHVLLSILGWFVVGLILLAVAARKVTQVTDTITKKPLQSFGAGLLFLITGPILLIIALVSIVGIPAGIILILLYATIIMLATPLIALWLGRLILSYKDAALPKNLLALLIGLIIIAAVRLVPIVGGLIGFLTVVLGAGALVREGYMRARSLQSKKASAK